MLPARPSSPQGRRPLPAESLADLPPPRREEGAAGAAAEDVLARPEYAEAQPGLIERAVDALQRGLAWGLDQLGGTPAGTALAAVALAALAGVVAWGLWRLVARTRRSGALRASADAQVGRAPRDWRADAEAAQAQGRRREAVRCWYRLGIAELAARGLVTEEPGATAGEDLARVRRGAPDLADTVALLTDAFERAWYARRPVTEPSLTAVRAAADDLAARLAQPDPSRAATRASRAPGRVSAPERPDGQVRR